MKKLTYIILAICVMMAVGCPSDSEMTDSISEAEAAVESHNTYTVTFDPNGGDGRAFSQSFRGGRMQPLMRCSFKRTGWTFSGGWAVEPDGEKVYRNNEQVILTKDLTLYAVWTAHKYTIKFDANGGAGDMEDLSMTYDVTKHLSPNEFTRAGYGFTGWNTASDGSGTGYANGAGISNLTATDNDVVTLYAQWAAGWVDYTVKRYFQTVDGAAYAQDTANYPNLTNSGITDTETAETAVPVTGFTAQPITQQTIAGDGSTVVNIYYNRNWITYTFSANGGKWSDSTTADKDVSGYYGAAVSVPVPEKTGYHYTWDSTVPTEFDENDGAEFTAQWTANSYKIKFDANGGTGTMDNMSMTYDIAKALTANVFTKTGYTFLGWSTNSSAASVAYTDGQSVLNLTSVSDGVVTLYAVWTVNTYTIVFDANGGTGEMNSQTMTYDVETALIANAFSKAGYTFLGWSDNSSATVATYTNEQSVLNLAISGSITLYAVWKSNWHNNGAGDFVYDNVVCEKTSMVTVLSQTTDITCDQSKGVFPTARGTVTLDKYAIGKYPVTQELYTAVMGSNPSCFKSYTALGTGETNYLLRPVEKVSWYDAITFCNKLSTLMGKTRCYKLSDGTYPEDFGTIPTSNNTKWDNATCDWAADGYRLPTGCEWECAARGGTYSAGTLWIYTYSGSNTVDDVAWYSSNSSNHTWEVGLKTANNLGIYDMSGNVWEWCWDNYYSTTIDSNTPVTGPASNSSSDFYCWLRGGSWTDGAHYCEVSMWGRYGPYIRDNDTGFRLACSVE